MIIMKFGGTSVGNAGRIRNVALLVKSSIKKRPVVVVSAVAKITDMLIELANECAQGKGNKIFEEIKSRHCRILQDLNINKELLNKDFEDLSAFVEKIKSERCIDAKRLDEVQSFGERMSSKVVAAELNKIGINAQAFNSWELGLLTDSNYGNAEPLETAYSNLKASIKKIDAVPVITGFVGKTEHGNITTLGRGGSDYTASIVGSAIGADEIQIWTDVDGIMSADPKVVRNAKTLATVSFAEASELAYFGAKVLHPKTILPAVKKNIPVKVLNSFKPEGKGTTIVNKEKRNMGKSRQIVKSIAYKKGITLIYLESMRMLGAIGFLARIFGIFERHKKSVDAVSTSEVSVSLTVDDEIGISKLISDLKSIANVSVERNNSIICVVGEEMRGAAGISGKIFSVLDKNRINLKMVSQGASKINLTFIIDEKHAEKAVRALHEEYFG